jgi:hypothetical protein
MTEFRPPEIDAHFERQMGRVVDAFRKAANKHWGPEDPGHVAIPCKSRKSSKSPKDEDPKRHAVRNYLLANPDASNSEIMVSTGASKHIVSELRVTLKIPAKWKRSDETRKQKQAREWFERNPDAKVSEASRKTGLSPRTCKRVWMRFEKAKANVLTDGSGAEEASQATITATD